ncbi:MAG TPA: hypothetical protein VEJ63_01260 [Planctomycetota bacterium]|nr:hypothetical protein [Planctomycetota bacterium]
MNENTAPSSKFEEERKRDAVMAQDSLKRWKLFLEGLEWAIANTPPEKRRNRPRRPHQN